MGKIDTNKINDLLEISQDFESNNTDSALYYLDICKSLIEKLDYTTRLARCYRGYASIYNITCKFQNGLDYSYKTLALATKQNDKKLIALAYRMLGLNYHGLNQYQTAVNYALLAVAYLDSIKDRTPDLRYENISWMYNDLKEYTKAIYYGEKGTEEAKKSNFIVGQAKCLNNTGIAYASLFNYSKAIECFNEQLKISDSVGNENEYNLALIGLCNAYYAIENNVMLHKFNKLLSAQKNSVLNINDLTMLEAFYRTQALVSIVDGQLQEAEKNVLAGFEFCKLDPYLGEYIELCHLYSTIKFSQKDFAKSSYFSFKADSVENSLVTLQLLGYTNDLETKYETKKKEAELLKKSIETRQQKYIIGALTFSILALFLVGFVQSRNYQVKKKLAFNQQQLAIADERIRIAADMHDDVGADLSRIRYITAAMKEGKHISNEDMDKILSLSDESVEKMNEIIWSLNQGNRKMEELIYHIRSHCAAMVNNANIEFECIMPDEIPPIILEWKQTRNIYLLVNEAVNNAVKHAAAGTITLNFYIELALHVTVKDNGKGFDINNIRKEANGLLNYKKRVEMLGGSYNIETLQNVGTTLNFTIPLAGIKLT